MKTKIVNDILNKILLIFMTFFFIQNASCQDNNILKLPIELNNIRIGKRIDSTNNFIKIEQHSLKNQLDRKFFFFKIDYIYSGKQIEFFDSVPIKSMFIGTDTNGIIQSIIISCKDSSLLRNNLFSIFGDKTTSSLSNLGASTSKLIQWQEDGYCVTLNVAKNHAKDAGKENDAILILRDCDYRHLLKKEYVDIISPKK